MSSSVKLLARGTLTFLEIAIVVSFIALLAAIAALTSLGARKRNQPPEMPGALFDLFSRGSQSSLMAKR